MENVRSYPHSVFHFGDPIPLSRCCFEAGAHLGRCRNQHTPLRGNAGCGNSEACQTTIVGNNAPRASDLMGRKSVSISCTTASNWNFAVVRLRQTEFVLA